MKDQCYSLVKRRNPYGRKAEEIIYHASQVEQLLLIRLEQFGFIRRRRHRCRRRRRCRRRYRRRQRRGRQVIETVGNERYRSGHVHTVRWQFGRLFGSDDSVPRRLHRDRARDVVRVMRVVRMHDVLRLRLISRARFTLAGGVRVHRAQIRWQQRRAVRNRSRGRIADRGKGVAANGRHAQAELQG